MSRNLLIITACPSGGLQAESHADSTLVMNMHACCEDWFKGYKIPGLTNWEYIIFNNPVIDLTYVVDYVKLMLKGMNYDRIRHYNTGHGVKAKIDGKDVYGLWWGDPKYFFPWQQIYKDFYTVLNSAAPEMSIVLDNCYSGGAKHGQWAKLEAKVAPKDFRPIVKAIELPELDMAVLSDVMQKTGEQPDIEDVFGVWAMCQKKETCYGQFASKPGGWLYENTQSNSLGTAAWTSAVDLSMRNGKWDNWAFVKANAQARINMLKNILPYPSEIKVHHVSFKGMKKSRLI